MKYATYTKQEDEKVIDENDFELIENWQKSSNIVEVDPPDSMEKKDLCYGVYLFNHGIDKLKSVEYMREMRGHYISTILYDKSSTVSTGLSCISHTLSCIDVHGFDAYPIGNIFYIPFAALIQLTEPTLKIINTRNGRLHCHIRYINITPVKNIIKRKGIIFIGAIERRYKNILEENWIDFIDIDRAISTSKKMMGFKR